MVSYNILSFTMSPISLHFLNFPCIVLFVFFQIFIPFAHPFFFHLDSDSSNPNINYEGDARPSIGKIVLPASDLPYRVGRAKYAKPLHLWDSCLTGSYGADFTTHFSFTIDNVNVSGPSGLAFFLARVGYELPPNSAGGELGLFNSTSDTDMTKNRIVMVEFHTSMQRVGISENSPRSTVNTNWDAKSHAGKAANVWITYKASTKNLSVFWTYEKNPVFKGKSHLSCHLDLKEVLPQFIKIGFSASTSSTHERYTIHSWDFHLNLNQSCNKMRRTILATSVAAGFLIMMLLTSIISWLVLKRRRIGNDQSHGNDADSESSISTNLERGALPRKFSYLELLAATNGFAKDRKLGQGGSGQVYKGTLSDLGRPVAVKRILTESEHSQSLFINEVKIISRLIHRNLVQFIGWCHEQGEFLLVYEHMTNGSLDHHLYGKGEALPWNARYKIVSGLASALHYLHEEAEQYCVLHRDIKSANILLDTDFSTKLGDFGVAKLVDPRLTPRRSRVVGTYGYLAPEYANEGRASKESDMFSFGVVALEISCGRRTFQDGEFHVSLVTWVWELYLAGDILKAADEKLGMNFHEDEIKRLLVVGLWCTQPNDRKRPKAGQVIKVLRLEAPLPELPHDMHEPGFHPLCPQSQDQSSSLQLTSSLDDLGR
ncbi:L-type lectin-domain containing receptor kinase IX.1-like [Juglans microcarpa x Juglans regia]|uniref:L-type lectin-domain containing receptor kinase IX.1-like n=1 Tax=Juglans microcarpa x Juglans regia TaxID=2249226 RepID=UPI001B7DE97F|nr:L-type lectin-domain containing receptor kinase IX.1-like [Juglans microcarpa x Juglans regia]